MYILKTVDESDGEVYFFIVETWDDDDENGEEKNWINSCTNIWWWWWLNWKWNCKQRIPTSNDAMHRMTLNHIAHGTQYHNPIEGGRDIRNVNLLNIKVHRPPS